MNAKVQLENSLKDALRTGDELRKRTLRMALAAIRQTEIDKGIVLDEPAVLAVLQKEIKSRHESIEDARRAGRPDLEEAALAEIAVLQGLLPQPFTPAELETLVKQVISEEGATGPRDMGRVMKALVPRMEGRATGDQASQVVRNLLQ